MKCFAQRKVLYSRSRSLRRLDPCTTGCSLVSLWRSHLLYRRRGFTAVRAAPMWQTETHTGAPYAAARPLPSSRLEEASCTHDAWGASSIRGDAARRRSPLSGGRVCIGRGISVAVATCARLVDALEISRHLNNKLMCLCTTGGSDTVTYVKPRP